MSRVKIRLYKHIKQITLLVGVVVLGMSLSVSAQSATGGIGGRPARPDADNPRSQSIFINTLDRGETVEDAVLVSNNSNIVRTVELYAVDGVVSNDGAYTCRQRTEPLVKSGAWIKLSKDEVVLEPGTREEVTFTITVPENADVGEHNACLVFADPEEKGEEKGGVRLYTRQATRVVTTIPGDLHREVSLNSFTVQSDNQKQVFSVEVQNKGNVSADTNIKVSLVSFFGKIVYDNGGVFPVLADESLKLSFENEKLPFWGGWYKARVDVEYNTNAKLLGFDEGADKATTLEASHDVFIVPNFSALIIIGVGLLAVIGLIVFMIIKGVVKRRRRQSWADYEVVDGDTVTSLAQERGVKWKLITKTNKLSPPYSLNAGQVIKLPTASKKQQRVDRDSQKTVNRQTSRQVQPSQAKSSQVVSQKRPLGGKPSDKKTATDSVVDDILRDL